MTASRSIVVASERVSATVSPVRPDEVAVLHGAGIVEDRPWRGCLFDLPVHPLAELVDPARGPSTLAAIAPSALGVLG